VADQYYWTHKPVLEGLPRLIKVERVLELGCGHHSTPMFLNRDIYPSLTELLVIETEWQWIHNLENGHGISHEADSRFQYIVRDPISSAVQELDLSRFDIVFVDDSDNDEKRAATIRAVTKCRTQNNVIVIHDWETWAYRSAAEGIPHQVSMTALKPHTGVLWDKSMLTYKALAILDSYNEEKYGKHEA